MAMLLVVRLLAITEIPQSTSSPERTPAQPASATGPTHLECAGAPAI